MKSDVEGEGTGRVGVRRRRCLPRSTQAGEGEYSQTAEGESYFESGRPGTASGCALWRARRDANRAEYLGPALGSGTYDADPFAAPDGSYLLFASYRAGGRGKADLCVTSPRGDHEWTTPVNLNEYCPGINTAAIEYAPSLSGDGRFLFFVRLDPDSPQCDIWWVENPIRAEGRP